MNTTCGSEKIFNTEKWNMSRNIQVPVLWFSTWTRSTPDFSENFRMLNVNININIPCFNFNLSFSTNFEFAKLRALLFHVSYVPTCLRVLCFCFHVPTCLCAFVFYVPTGSEILMKKSTYFSMPNFDKIFLNNKIALNWMTICKYNSSRKIMIITFPNFASIKIFSHNLTCMSLYFKMKFILVYLCIKS